MTSGLDLTGRWTLIAVERDGDRMDVPSAVGAFLDVDTDYLDVTEGCSSTGCEYRLTGDRLHLLSGVSTLVTRSDPSPTERAVTVAIDSTFRQEAIHVSRGDNGHLTLAVARCTLVFEPEALGMTGTTESSDRSSP